jgi:AbrB family looped-hinge helix DNA binding protein
MAATTMTARGQITIPASVRAEMGAHTGDRIEFVPLGNGRFELMVANLSVQDIKGAIRKPDRPVSIDDMNKAIAAHGAAAR